MTIQHTSADKTIAADRFFYVYRGEGKQEVAMTFMALMIEFGLFALQNSRTAFNTQYEKAQETVKSMEMLNEIMQWANKIKANFKSDDKSEATTDAGKFFQKVNEFNRMYPNSKIDYNGHEIAVATLDLTKLKESRDWDEMQRKSFDGKSKNENIKDEEKKKKYAELAAAYEKNITAKDNLIKKWEEIQKDIKDGDPPSLDDLQKYKKEYYDKVISFSMDIPGEDKKAVSQGADNFVSGYYVSSGGIQQMIGNLQTAQSTLSTQNEQQSMRTNQAMNRSSGFLQQLQNMMQSAKEALQAASKAGGA